jgi:tetratricopeptide (TPR) repeat protein
MLGRTLGRYRVVERIGSGGMGVVYRARDERLDRDVALKVILPGPLDDDVARKRFRREALALSRLNHPNIATLHDFDSHDGVDFVVMEFLDGVTLSARLRGRAMVPLEVIRIGLQIVAGLEEAHDCGIIHRDLKPGNVMLTPKGQVKILDFGLSTAVRTSGDANVTVALSSADPMTTAGTLPYMSPEQVLGQPADARTDVWAVGAVLYEMATSHRPFPEEQATALIGAILHRPIRPPHEVNPAVTPGLEHLITKALEKDPAERYQTARELHVALEQLQASPTSSTSRVLVPRAGQRARGASLAAAAFLLLTVGVAVWKYLGTTTVIPHQRVLTLVGEVQNRTGEPVFDKTLQDLMSIALEQSQVVSVFPSSRVQDALTRMQRAPETPIDEAVGREICQREGVQALVEGSISKIGNNYILIVRASSAGGATLASEQRFASDASKVPVELDAIARKIRAGLGESAALVQASSTPLAQVTSASLEAVRYVTLGRQRQERGDPSEDITWFDKAITLDPSFATAHLYLGIAYQNVGNIGRAESEMHAAAQLADRVTATERLRILGDYHVLIGDYDAGCADFQALARLQPQDPAPFHGLGLCNARRMAFDVAIAESEKALAMVPSIPTRYNIARMNLHRGDLARGRSGAEAILQESPNHAGAHRLLARVFELGGQVPEAKAHFRSMIDAGAGGEVNGRVGLADLLRATGHPRDARVSFEAAVIAADKRDDAVATARARVALAELLLDDAASRAEGLQLLARVPAAATDPELIVRIGRAYARGARLADAQRVLSIMKQVADAKPYPHLKSLHEQLVTDIAIADGRAAVAVESAARAVQLEPSVVAVDALARAFDAAGRTADAVRAYNEVLVRAASRADGDDDPSFRRVVDIHYRLGVLLQDSGQTADARTHLETFLKYWSDADPNLEMKKDATNRVRRLAQTMSSPNSPLTMAT